MMQEDRKLINSAADALKSNSTGILERIEKLQAELKDAEHELSALKKNKVQDELKELIQNAEVKMVFPYWVQLFMLIIWMNCVKLQIL